MRVLEGLDCNHVISIHRISEAAVTYYSRPEALSLHLQVLIDQKQGYGFVLTS